MDFAGSDIAPHTEPFQRHQAKPANDNRSGVVAVIEINGSKELGVPLRRWSRPPTQVYL
jgi:hypothetical protein